MAELNAERYILNVVRRMEPNNGAGVDGIPSLHAIKCAKIISLPLLLMCNVYLATESFSSLFKNSLVLPIFKNGKGKMMTKERLHTHFHFSYIC